jgi:hypothetical protein
MFSASAEDAAPAAADLTAALEWLEGQASDSGPFIMGAELTLVRCQGYEKQQGQM